ncbi:MAG: M48 family metallopeptidase [Cyanophyceae cyanobacterium]
MTQPHLSPDSSDPQTRFPIGECSSGWLFPLRRAVKRWGYGAIALLLASTIVVSTPSTSQAIDFGDIFNILRNGIRVYQLSNLSDRQEVELGEQIDRQLKRSQIRVITSPDVVAYVDDIGQRLARNSNRPNIPYQFQVVRDAKVNAFATMGGFVYINAGLMVAADNEAQLSGVISHEIGHITERHAVNQMRQRAIAQGVASAAGLDRSRAVQIGVELALNRPKSRRDELEADDLGLTYLNRAGYAPQALPNFLRKLLRASSPPTILSTHPNTGDRIALLEAKIAQIPESQRGKEGLNELEYRKRIDGWFKITPANSQRRR